MQNRWALAKFPQHHFTQQTQLVYHPHMSVPPWPPNDTCTPQRQPFPPHTFDLPWKLPSRCSKYPRCCCGRVWWSDPWERRVWGRVAKWGCHDSEYPRGSDWQGDWADGSNVPATRESGYRRDRTLEERRKGKVVVIIILDWLIDRHSIHLHFATLIPFINVSAAFIDVYIRSTSIILLKELNFYLFHGYLEWCRVFLPYCALFCFRVPTTTISIILRTCRPCMATQDPMPNDWSLWVVLGGRQ